MTSEVEVWLDLNHMLPSRTHRGAATDRKSSHGTAHMLPRTTHGAMKTATAPVDVPETIRAGTLRSRGTGRREQASFEYEASFLAHPGAYALDPTLPLKVGSFETSLGRSMFGAFTDVAPDRWGRRLLERAITQGVITRDSTPTEFDFILGVRDDLRQGNLRFRFANADVFIATENSGFPLMVELEKLLNAAERFDAEEGDDNSIKLLLTAGSSIGGARPKAAVVDEKGLLCIAKFPRASTDDWDVMAWERLTLMLAEQSGIAVPKSDLVTVNGKNVLIVRRFDRKLDGNRIGYISAMTLLEATEGDTGSYVEIAEAITENGLQVKNDLNQLWRRIAFNIAISNTDDHLRNLGFLRSDDGPGWNLSPAFDLNPEPRAKRPQLTTAIRPGAHDADINILLEEISAFRLDKTQALQIVDEVNTAVASWPSLAEKLGISELERQRVGPAFRKLQTR